MLKLSKTSKYIETYTLSGKKLILGDVENDSYVVIRNKKAFYSLLQVVDSQEINEISELPNECQPLAKSLKIRGYLDDDTPTVRSFNEYAFFSKTLYSKKLRGSKTMEQNHVILSIVYFLLLVLLLSFSIIHYTNSDLSLNYSEFSVSEIVFSVTVLPITVISIHEAGHYASSRIAGIAADELRVGFYILYPTVYLSYKGINVSKTRNRLIITSGGVFAHALSAVIGFFFYRNYGANNITVIWIISNISMIISSIVPLSASDGYFFLCSLLGVYNLRLKGYTALGNWMHGRFRTKTWPYGLLLLSLWGISFWGLSEYLQKISQKLLVAQWIRICLILVIICGLLFRFGRYLYLFNEKAKK